MQMREYQSSDLQKVMEIANIAWREIRKMSRAALGDRISDELNPAGDAESKGLQVKEQIDGGNYGIAVCEHDRMVVGFITYRIDGVWGEMLDI